MESLKGVPMCRECLDFSIFKKQVLQRLSSEYVRVMFLGKWRICMCVYEYKCLLYLMHWIA